MREAVREADNVSEKVTPIVRIRNLGDNGVDYEVKYWLDDYAKYNDTDALVRQRIWYAFRRAGLNFAYPTRTLFVERQRSRGPRRRRQRYRREAFRSGYLRPVIGRRDHDAGAGGGQSRLRTQRDRNPSRRAWFLDVCST